MKLLVLADIHGDIKTLRLLCRSVKDCDAVVIAGDITDFGGAQQANAVLAELQGLGVPVMAVPGNCDSPQANEALMRKHSSLVNNPVQFNGVVFVGYGYPVCETLGPPNESIFPQRPDCPIILVTHEPAWDTDVDLQASTRHRGSRSVRSWIEHYQPLLAVSGHIHEAYGTDQIGTTVLVNPGPLRNGRYATVEVKNSTVRVQLHWVGE